MISQRTLVVVAELLLLALGAFFAATTVNAMIAEILRPPLEVKLEAVAEKAPESSKQPLSRYAAITEKDIFNPPRPFADSPAAPTVTPLRARLLGTAPGEGIESFAVIEDEGTKKQDLYRIGDRFQDRTLERIEWDHVILKHGGKEEILKVVQPAGGPAPPVAALAPEGQAVAGIERVSDTSYLVDRREVDQAMENMNQIFTQIRAVPHFQDGKASGFRVFAIRRDSIFDKLGLKNGDIVSRINGNDLTDPARAMALVQDLRGAGSAALEVTRNRQPVTLNYEVR